MIPTLILLALATQAQDLPAPVGSVTELREVTSLAEVAPDRIALAQPEEQHVLIVDLNTGKTTRVGREGRGPGEFIFPYFVFPLRERRFAVVDGALARTSYFTSDGTLIADSLIPPRLDRTGLMLDALGRAYTSDTAPPSGYGPRGVLYRYFPETDSTLELVNLATLPRVRSSRDPELTQALTYAAHDEAGILPDGTVWVARHDPVHVEWRSVDGQWTSSRHFPLPRLRTTPADSVFVPGLPVRDRGRPVTLPMAEVKGPFENAVAASDGEVWLRLYGKAGEPYVTYLVVPRSGQPRRFRLPVGKHVLAVGGEYVYLTHEDDNGFTELEWAPRP